VITPERAPEWLENCSTEAWHQALDQLSLDEIDAEIKAVRETRQEWQQMHQ